MRKLGVFAALLAAALCGQVAIAGEPGGGKDGIPIKVNVGVGFAKYRFLGAYQDRDSEVTGTQLSLQGVVDQQVLKRYEGKIPEKFRKPATSLNEVSVTHWAIPKTLYIHPDDGRTSAFGATWGIVPGLKLGMEYFRLGLSGGVVATYMYHKDSKLGETVHFLRPGLRGSVNFTIPIVRKYLIFESGVVGDIYWPQAFYGDDKVAQVSGTYALLHFRIPMTVAAKL